MKIWDIATSNQGGRDLASFVGTMNKYIKSNPFLYSKLEKWQIYFLVMNNTGSA